MATQVNVRYITPEEFVEMDFGDAKAELDNGVVRMMPWAEIFARD